jgi:FdhD protein
VDGPTRRDAQLISPFETVDCMACGSGAAIQSWRDVAEEVPIAFVYDGSTHAVMMATPADLEDFAIGFSRSEGIIEHPTDIADLQIVKAEHGIELRVWLRPLYGSRFQHRRRRLAGPVGCGLCGIDSIAAAHQTIPRLTSSRPFHWTWIGEATQGLPHHQFLNEITHATHAAGYFVPGSGLVAVREDVGRHNALDKLAGALSRQEIDGGKGAAVITSRVSVEMVQKAAILGAPVLIAMSAPTALAVRTAEAANMTLVAVARGRSFEVFSGVTRIWDAYDRSAPEDLTEMDPGTPAPGPRDRMPATGS